MKNLSPENVERAGTWVGNIMRDDAIRFQVGRTQPLTWDLRDLRLRNT
jgi:hypothetical protein